MPSEKRFQSFREGPEGRVVRIEAFYHDETRQYLIDWGDIKDVFPKVAYILKEDAAVPRTRDSRRIPIEPRCIQYHQDIVLEVVTGETSWNGTEAAFSLPSSSRGFTLDNTNGSDPKTSHPRTNNTASSLLRRVNSVQASADKHNIRAVGDRSPVPFDFPEYLLLPSETPSINSNNMQDVDAVFQNIHAPFRPPTPLHKPHSMMSKSTQEQHVWSTSAAEGPISDQDFVISVGSKSASYCPPWQADNVVSSENSRVMDIGNGIELISSSKDPAQSNHRSTPQQDFNHAPQFGDISPFPPSRFHTSPTATTAVVRVEQPGSLAQSRHFMQRMESAVQLFGQHMAKGQHDQALLVKQESETIKKDMALYYGNLQTEVTKNTTLQNQVKEMVAASEKMTKRILELQEAQMDNDNRMMAKLALIHSKATAILTQTYELHEFPIPRLFIILPKEDITKREKIGTMFVKRFRLYFLCECGEHTRPADGPPSSLSHDIHLARHEGYDLDRPNEFFRKYGSYVLALLQMLKYGVVAAGMVVPPLNAMKIADELAVAEAGLKVFEKDFAPRVDSAIEYLQGISVTQESMSKDSRNSSSTTTLVDPVSIGKLEGLEGADLRHLGSFLKASDEGKVLGNLYRTVTPQGHVKWVCLDHYRESYGAAALQEFKETVELNSGAYDQRTGRVTVRLMSPTFAGQFYNMLVSTRLVHELELTLSWNTTFEDLRILKNALQQSNVVHLALDICGKTGPTSDFVYRHRRSEPIVQIMASGKLHTLTLRNTTGFLSQTKELLKTTLHVRRFHLEETITSVEDFVKLEKLIHASSKLTRLGVVVGDIDKAFERLRPLVARHKSLSALDLQLPDGEAVSVQFEPLSDEIRAVGLTVVDTSSNFTKLVRSPMVKTLVVLPKDQRPPHSQYIQDIAMQHRGVKEIQFTQLLDGAIQLLQELQQKIDSYPRRMENRDSGFEAEGIDATVTRKAESKAVSRLEGVKSLHEQSMLSDMVLIIASAAEEEKPECIPIQATSVTPGSTTIDHHYTASMFIFQREDNSLTFVQLVLGDGGSNSAVIRFHDVDTFDGSRHFQATMLTVTGGESVARFKELLLKPTTQFCNLRTLEIGCASGDLLDILHYVHQNTTQYPTLTRLNVWSTTKKITFGFDLPLRELDLLDHLLSPNQLPSLQELLRGASTVSSILLSLFPLNKAFEIVCSTAQLHKQLSSALLVAGKSRLSIQFIVGSGVIESIALCVRGSELIQLLSLPKVTELDIVSLMELSFIQEIVPFIFSQCQHLNTLRLNCRTDQLLDLISITIQGVAGISALLQLVLTEVDLDLTRRTERVFDLPLGRLDIASHYVDEKALDVMERLVRASPGLHELYISVSSVDVAQRIFDCIVQERRPITTLSMSLSDVVMAVFSLEADEEGGALTATQKITQPELDKTFFLPSAKIQRVDVVGGHIEKSHASEIVAFVLRHYCGVGSIRFVDLPEEVEDIAIVIKDSIQRGLFLQDIERRKKLTAGTDDWKSMTAATKGAELAFYSAHSNDIRDEPLTRGVEGESLVSSIVRALQDGTVEAIELDWTDPDGVTLRINAVAFEKSNFAQHPDVTRLAVVVRHGSISIDNLVSIPIFTFMGLKQLEISCLLSLDLNALLAAFEAAPNHPALKQIQIWCPDQSYNRITFDLPIKILDLSWYPLPPTEHQVLQTIAAINPLLTELTVKVAALLPAFEVVSSSMKSFGVLEQLHLNGEVGSMLSIQFNPVASAMVSVMLSSMEIQDSVLSWDVPVLRMMEFTDTTLDLIKAIQTATVNNPGLQSLVLKDWMGDPRITLELPFRKIDLSKRAISLERVKTLKRLLLACPQLSELCLPLDSVAYLHEAVTIFGPVFQKYKKLTDVRLTLQNGTEVSVRYSGVDGTVSSLAIRTSGVFAVNLSSMPMIKKITILPKDTSIWRDADHTKNELTKILAVYQTLETLELDCILVSPFPSLRFLATYSMENPISPFRRFRHRLVDAEWTDDTFLTHDLPLRKLDLGDYFVDKEEFPELKVLFHSSPRITSLKMSVPTSAVINQVFETLKGVPVVYNRLRKLSINSQDGYGMLFQLQRPKLLPATTLKETGDADDRVDHVELQVSGIGWPSSILKWSVTKLKISPISDAEKSSNIGSRRRIRDILSKASQDLVDINYLTLTCPIAQFFAFLPNAVKFPKVFWIYLQDPKNQRIIVAVTKFRPAPVITICLDNISDQDLLGTCSFFFGNHLLKVEVAMHANEELELSVSMDYVEVDERRESSLGQVVWDTQKVSFCRILELLGKLSSSRKKGVPILFRFISLSAFEAAGTGRRPNPNGSLRNAETISAIVRIIVQRATEVDLELESVAQIALLPGLKSDIEKQDFGVDDMPLGRLRKYRIAERNSPFN